LRLVTGHDEIDALAFSPDGATVAVAGQAYDPATQTMSSPIILFDTATGKRTATLAGSLFPSTLVFLSDRRLMAFNGKGGWEEWDPVRNTRLRSGTLGGERSVHWARVGLRDERTLILGVLGEAVVFDLKEGKEVRSVRATDPAARVVPCPAGRLLAVTEHQDVDLLDVRTGKRIGSLLDHPGAVGTMAFGPDGRLLVAASTRHVAGKQGHTFLRVWDVADRKALRDIALGPAQLMDFALCPRGRFLAVCAYPDWPHDPELRLYTLKGGEVARVRIKWPKWRALATFAPDGRRLAITQSGAEVRLFDLPER
jgi:WD40 repeat protein